MNEPPRPGFPQYVPHLNTSHLPTTCNGSTETTTTHVLSHRAGIPVAQLQMQLQHLQMQYQMLQGQYQTQAMAVANNPQQAMMLQAQFMQQQQMIRAQMQQVQQVSVIY